MKRYNVLFLIVLVLFISSQVAIIVEKYDLKRYITRNITIESVTLDELNRLLLSSQSINSSYLFKLNGLRKNHTYEIHIWVEQDIDGKIIKNTLLEDSINTFSTRGNLKQTYLLITFNDSETQCILFLENQSDIISSCGPIGNINSSGSVPFNDTENLKNNAPFTLLTIKKSLCEEYRIKLKISRVS